MNGAMRVGSHGELSLVAITSIFLHILNVPGCLVPGISVQPVSSLWVHNGMEGWLHPASQALARASGGEIQPAW